MSREILRRELLEDPAGIGYAAMDDATAASALNAATVPRAQVSAQEIYEAIDRTEWSLLSIDQRELLRLIMSWGTVEITDRIKNDFSGMFPPGSVTRTRLRALADETIPRWQAIGLARQVSAEQVAGARSG